jgi:hypothetical protein
MKNRGRSKIANNNINEIITLIDRNDQKGKVKNKSKNKNKDNHKDDIINHNAKNKSVQYKMQYRNSISIYFLPFGGILCFPSRILKYNFVSLTCPSVPPSDPPSE